MKFEISISEGVEIFEPVEIESFEHLAEIACKFNYSLSTYRNNKRNLSNFLSAAAVGVDIDNDSESESILTLEEAKLAFKDYQHIILTTKSHQKEKHGLIRDRFRVILFLSTPITDIEIFYATWQTLKTKYPAIDRKCKDASRFWYPSPQVVSINKTGELIHPSAPLPKPETKKPISTEGTKGELTRKTLSFLLNGSNKGGRNNNTYKAAKDFQNKGHSLEEAIEKITNSFTNLDLYSDDFTEREVINTIQSAYRGEPLPTYDYYPNKGLEELLYEGQLIANREDPSETVLFVKEKRITMPIHKTAVKEVLGNSKNAFDNYVKTHMIHAEFHYNRKDKRILYLDKITNSWVYNCYTPPKWQEKNFYSNEPLPKAPSEVPEIYKEFFTHITNSDKKSYEYILDWLATAMQARNYTILCAIGEQGIGKGILGTIMENLVGEKNFVRTRDEIFKNKFNGQLRNKCLVYIDEVRLKDIEAHNRLKDIVNDKIEVEAKGVDAKHMDNHASYYLSSNQFDAVKPEPGDRRFSIIELTDTKLTETKLVDRIQEIFEENNIRNLALYLLERKVVNNMLQPFYSKRSEEIKEASLSDWELFVVFSWTQKNLGKEVPLKQLQDDVAKEFGYKSAPGRRRFEMLARKYPEYLRIRQSNPNNISERYITAIDSPNKIVPLKDKIKLPQIEKGRA